MMNRSAGRCLMAAGVAMALFTAAPPAGADGTAAAGHVAAQKRAAAKVTSTEANARQATAVSHGQANSVLANPYVEQKVTTAESTGVNATRIPAGGF
jgi:hypothetical protein